MKICTYQLICIVTKDACILCNNYNCMYLNKITRPKIKPAMWRRCLSSAFRTGIACTIVGCATLYGPKFIKQQVTFTAFSYVTVVLIVTDATLGDTFHGSWMALYATVQGVCPAIPILWLIGPARLTTITTTGLVAASAFVVAALPGNTNLIISKRIALGQIVIVYVRAFVKGESTDHIMHPVHVAASTAIGVVACVLALLLPYPSLAYYQVKKDCKIYTENASKRLNLFVKAFSAEEITLSKALISQANILKITGAKLLQSIKSKQKSMHWETLPIKFLKSHNTNPVEKLQDLETVLKGMEIALSNCSQIPHRLLNSEIKDDISILEEQLLNQIKNTTNENRVLAESNREKDSNFLQTHQISLTSKDLPYLFFIFCLNFQDVSARKQLNDSKKKKNIFFTKKRLMPAIKCSISLGLAVLLGLLYSKENGYWSGLMVAISFAPSREATFRAANVKLQGTVLGTVYAVIFCFILKKYEKIRIISLLPWFVFCSFLCESRMYEKAGGMSAVISAVFILGRDNIGTPSEFGIARLVEIFIGLFCSVLVDIVLQPRRGSVLAKLQLLISLHSLHECVGSINLASFNRLRLEESLKKLKLHVNELGKLIEEAVVEPNLWFLPFHSACYRKIEGSLSKMTDILFYGSYALRFIEQELRKMGSSEIWEEAIVKLEIDVKLLRDVVCSRIKCFEEVSSVKSLEVVDRDLEKRKITLDQHEMRRYQMSYSLESTDEMEQNTSCFLQHLEELVSVGGGVEIEDGVELRNKVVLSLSALVFCMNGLLLEIKEIENTIEELLQWENPSKQVDLHNIRCKIHAGGRAAKELDSGQIMLDPYPTPFIS